MILARSTDSSDAATTVVVDLIGDLDPTLASVVAEALDGLSPDGAGSVRVRTSHVRNASCDGVAALARALDTARASGLAVILEVGNRTVKTAFANAHLVGVPFTTGAPRDRHLLLARRAV